MTYDRRLQFSETMRFCDITPFSERLYLGCFADSASGVTVPHGITAVCNLTQDHFEGRNNHPHLDAYQWLNTIDGEEVPWDRIPLFLAWMERQQADDQVVLLHCHAGISRTSSFAILWLMWSNGVRRTDDLRQAWSKYEQQIGEVRPIIQPHTALKRSILAWYELYGPE